MAEERDIEKLLRAYGKKRQENAPETLHPATRRLLLGEVARKFPRDGSRPASAVWFGWWKQIAWVGGLCGALALTVYVVAFRPARSTNLAKSESLTTEAELAKADSLAPSAPVAEAPALQLSRELSAAAPKLMEEAVRDEVAPAAPAVPAQTPPPRSVPNDERRLALKAETAPAAEAKQFNAPAEPITTPAASADGFTRSARLEDQERGLPALTLQPEVAPATPALAGGAYAKQVGRTDVAVLFTNQVDDKSASSSSRARVSRARIAVNPLQSFRFLVSSNVVQLVDSDGSIYTGAYEVAEPMILAQPLTVTEPPAEAAALAAPSRAFQAVGTNATSGQQITVRGVAQFRSTALSVIAQKAQPTSRSAAIPSQNIVLPVKIEGSAISSDGRQVNIRAVRTEP